MAAPVMNPRVHLVRPEVPVSPSHLTSEYIEAFSRFQRNKGPLPGCFLIWEAREGFPRTQTLLEIISIEYVTGRAKESDSMFLCFHKFPSVTAFPSCPSEAPRVQTEGSGALSVYLCFDSAACFLASEEWPVLDSLLLKHKGWVPCSCSGQRMGRCPGHGCLALEQIWLPLSQEQWKLQMTHVDRCLNSCDFFSPVCVF